MLTSALTEWHTKRAVRAKRANDRLYQRCRCRRKETAMLGFGNCSWCWTLFAWQGLGFIEATVSPRRMLLESGCESDSRGWRIQL